MFVVVTSIVTFDLECKDRIYFLDILN